MQFTEFNIWTKLEKNKNMIINNLPIYITLTIHYISFTIALSITDSIPKNIKKIYITMIGLILLSIIIKYFVIHESTELITIGPNGHLNWNLNMFGFYGIIYMIVICGSMLLLSYYTKSHYISSIGTILVLLLSIKNYCNTGEMGSMWCYWFNLIGLLLLVKL
jgi:hypothetical protein